MRKIIIVVMVIAATAALSIFLFKSQILEFFFHAFVDEPPPVGDLSAWEQRISEFKDGTSSRDRDFLLKKLAAFSASARSTYFARLAYKYYYEELERAAADRTLDAEENSRLRALYSEVLPEEVIDKWFREGGELVIGED